MFGPKKVWGPFFWNSYFFWNPYFYWHYVWHQKVWIPFFLEPFFWNSYIFLLEPWNPYFVWRNVWPEKVWVVPFSGTARFFFLQWFFDEQNIWISQRCLSSGTLDSKYLCCWIVFVFADKGLHFIGFLSLGDFKFPWTRACVVSLVHAFWLSGSDFLKD